MTWIEEVVPNTTPPYSPVELKIRVPPPPPPPPVSVIFTSPWEGETILDTAVPKKFKFVTLLATVVPPFLTVTPPAIAFKSKLWERLLLG